MTAVITASSDSDKVNTYQKAGGEPFQHDSVQSWFSSDAD